MVSNKSDENEPPGRVSLGAEERKLICANGGDKRSERNKVHLSGRWTSKGTCALKSVFVGKNRTNLVLKTCFLEYGVHFLLRGRPL